MIKAGNEIDTLTPVAVKSVLAASLRAGMILVDEFDCPTIAIDHRIKAAVRGTGQITFLVEDLERGGWHDMTIRATKIVKVAA